MRARPGALRRGRETISLNPKVPHLPQFIAADSAGKVAAFLVLGLRFVATGTAWVARPAPAAAHVRAFFTNNPRAEGSMLRTMGGVFVLLGVRPVALDR